MHGEMNELWTHLTASIRIGDVLRPTAERRPRSQSMIDVCTFLQIISDSTNWDLTPIPWDCRSPILAEASFPFYNSGVLESTYGITAALAALLLRTTKVAQAMQFYLCHDGDPPQDFLSICNDLSTAIEALPTMEPTPKMPHEPDDHTNILLNEHLEAFALGMKVYYHSRVLLCTQDLMGELVQNVLQKLNTIEQRKQQSESQYAKTATIAWPGFIASCEALPGQRDGWTWWWMNMQSYGIGNIERLWDVVQEVWDRRDKGSTISPGWLPILREKRKFILAI